MDVACCHSRPVHRAGLTAVNLSVPRCAQTAHIHKGNTMKTTRRILSVACLLATAMTAPSVWADGAGTQAAPVNAPLQLEWDARLRHEQVDDAGSGCVAAAGAGAVCA